MMVISQGTTQKIFASLRKDKSQTLFSCLFLPRHMELLCGCAISREESTAAQLQFSKQKNTPQLHSGQLFPLKAAH